MAARVVVEREAVERLNEDLGLTVNNIERAVLRAEAEAATCTAFDPPIMAGFMRYGRTVRFLREDLVPLGWGYDNPRNFCRTINPSREFAIVSTSGDEATGIKLNPTTKYPKGYATAQAVDTNGQLAFDFSEVGSVGATTGQTSRATRDLVLCSSTCPMRSSGPNFAAERHVDGRITRLGGTDHFATRSPLRCGSPAAKLAQADDDGDEGEHVVDVNRR